MNWMILFNEWSRWIWKDGNIYNRSEWMEMNRIDLKGLDGSEWMYINRMDLKEWKYKEWISMDGNE